ncbi:MAG TPA: M20/M25/M40 family metallo-hydrolase, partial [Candidatus Ozemobacteraceae bacterium]|nr:M20/M25/M40 family metallo-hydrolase [Candidatus Ozemobacteraceae bacterium]
MSAWQAVDSWLDAAVNRMVEFQRELVAIPAIAPESGGDGEYLKARHLELLLQKMCWKPILDFPAPDDRVSHRQRPNLVYRRPGAQHDYTVWIMAHTDVVPEGDRTKWQSEPFTMVQKQDLLIGRGVEDNHQGLTAGVFALQALSECAVVSNHDVGMIFVADEECGSQYGIQYLLRAHPDLFGPRDVVLVPDSGNSDGTMIEVAEKSILWLKFTTTGKQCHASRPYNGKNAFAAAAELVVSLGRLPEVWPQ